MMKKITALAILMMLTTIVAGTAFAGQYQGGPGSGGAMAEGEFRLDGKSKPKNEIASAPSALRNDRREPRNDGSGPQYRGGQGSGGAMGECEGRLDGKKK